MEALYILLGAALLSGGFLLGWKVRDRLRPADEPSFPVIERPLAPPREIGARAKP